jgi:hypothetical protein
MRSHAGRLLFVCLAIGAVAGVASGQGLFDLDRIPVRKPGPPVDFGTTQETFVSIGEWEFAPVSSDQPYADLGVAQSNLLRYSTLAGGGFLAPVRVPDGAILTSVTFHLCDGSSTAQHWGAALATAANLDGSFAIVGSQLNSVSNVANPCAAYTEDLTPFNVVADSQSSRIVLIAATLATNASNALAGATVGYKLRVSPAPGTATFNDVPTNHPFFQYIEALAKSGITGGCGSGNYCPDAPVTRGQMAVFLAKGLGLQFP